MAEDKDPYYMQEALKEAKKGYKKGEVPVGAVLVLQGKIIARGHNQVELLKDATAHAEMLCLTSGASALQNWRLLNTTLYCTLEPCMMCMGAMLLSRVARLCYGASDLRHGACGSFINVLKTPYPTHALSVSGGVLEEESAFLMRDFFQKRRRGEDVSK